MMCIELLENGKSGKVQRNFDLHRHKLLFNISVGNQEKRNFRSGTNCNGDGQGKRLIEAPTQCRGDIFLLTFFPLLTRPIAYLKFYKTSSLSKVNTESCNGEEIFHCTGN